MKSFPFLRLTVGTTLHHAALGILSLCDPSRVEPRPFAPLIAGSRAAGQRLRAAVSSVSMLLVVLALLALSGCVSCPSEGGKTAERRTDFNRDWTFHLGDEPEAWRPDYDDSAWRRLDLPHDWAIEGDFSQDNPSGTGGGALPGGVGWYRKTFRVDAADEGRLLRLDFDGVYMNATVYINGHELGTRPYGYASFSYDLTPHVAQGEDNVVAVRVDNAEQPNSRWYSGCGIYRNVWLTRLNPVHVALWGTWATADEVSKHSARIRLITRVEHGQSATDDGRPVMGGCGASPALRPYPTEAIADEASAPDEGVTDPNAPKRDAAPTGRGPTVDGRQTSDCDVTPCDTTQCDATPAIQGHAAKAGEAMTRPASVTVTTTLLGAQGQAVGQVASGARVAACTVVEVSQELILSEPHLWSVDDPYLYSALTEVRDSLSGRVLDSYLTPVGIRTFAFDAKQGFVLNGERMKINGVCLHHDAGCLGAVVNRRAIERQLQTLKAMGCNGIRCTHNPPAPELLDLCDRMGFVVMDETFDMWRRRKTAHDYARYFDLWHERDLIDLVRRDRNHPSVMVWSIGNEVLEQWTDVQADTLSVAEANLLLNFGHGETMLAREGKTSVNSLLTQKLARMVRQLDPTRPITAGCNEPSPKNHLFRSGALDLIGFNYHDDWFAGVPENFPGRPFIITESVSALMTRGYYRMPSDSVVICPERWDKPYTDPTMACSSYDNCHVPWGNRHEGTLRHVKNNDFISGQFIWTGYDYLGEPTPYGWPARSSYFGLIDLAGFPKDIYYMYQSEWRPDLTVLHLFPHWNWEPGQEVDLWVYYNQADEVELWVNGVSQGVRSKGAHDFHVAWRVVFEPGTVRVVSRRDGQVVATHEMSTAGQPACLRLTPDRTVLTADGRDLSYVTVEVTDAEGRLCPWADDEVTFALEGPGVIAGVDNGSPTSLERFKASQRRAFYGRCLVVLQSTHQTGTIRLRATSPDLEGDAVSIKVKSD